MIQSKIGWISILAIFIFFSCTSRNPELKEDSKSPDIPVKYAQAFSISENDGVYTLVSHSVDKSQIFQTIQINGAKKSDEHVIHFPEAPEKIIAVSTTYLPYLESLNKLQSISAISNSKLIYSQKVTDLIESGNIIDIGNDQSLNYELILDINPDLILFYDFGATTSKTIEKLEGLGLKVVRISEFREVSPLGKAEWIKFFGVLFGEREKSDSIFESIENAYLKVLETDFGQRKSPTVFTGLPWKGEWYQPGGHSFQARLIEDAGGAYLWNDDDHVSSIVVDREVVFNRAMEADVWLHPSNSVSKTEISEQDERFTHFHSFKTGNIFNNNRRLNDNMGNDYWESGMLKPHLVLQDLMAIFYPDMFPEHKYFYYRKVD